MKLGKGKIPVEYIKRLTLRTVREMTEGRAEFYAFIDAMDRHDYDESKCLRESRQLEKTMTAKKFKAAADSANHQQQTPDISTPCIAAMETLQSADPHMQKENVETAHVPGKLEHRGLGASSLGKAKRGLSTPREKSKLDANVSASKPRRALGDISNQNRGASALQTPGKASKSALQTPSKLAVQTPNKLALQTPNKPRSVKRQREATPIVSSGKKTRRMHEEVEEIEHAYGGLPTVESRAEIMDRLRNEFLHELMHDKTPSILDDFDPELPSRSWREQEPILEEEVTDTWWTAPELPEDDENDDPTIDVPPLDDGLDPLADNLDDGDLLGELLSTDVGVLADPQSDHETENTELSTEHGA